MAKGHCDIGTHKNSTITLSTPDSVGGNRNRINPLPSVEDIEAVAQNETMENAIFIAQTEIAMIDELSLEGDLPDDISLQHSRMKPGNRYLPIAHPKRDIVTYYCIEAIRPRR